MEENRWEEQLKKVRDLAEGTFSHRNGIRLVNLAEGKAEAELSVDRSHTNEFGSVHGGCLYTLADETAGYAAWTLGRSCVTVDSHVSFLNAALFCRILRCEAAVIKDGERLAVVETKITDEKGKEILRGTFHYMPVENGRKNGGR